jgi:hypothetical protein
VQVPGPPGADPLDSFVEAAEDEEMESSDIERQPRFISSVNSGSDTLDNRLRSLLNEKFGERGLLR